MRKTTDTIKKPSKRAIAPSTMKPAKAPKRVAAAPAVEEKPQWGGHITGFRSDISKGSGPVFDARRLMGLSQAEMGQAIGCAQQTVKALEREGRTPRNQAVLTNLVREVEKLKSADAKLSRALQKLLKDAK